jgi:hypothetical protein
MSIKSKTIPEEMLWPILNSIHPTKLRIYATLLYCLACRSGELLPYTHYKIKYKKTNKGKLIRNENGNPIIEKRIINYESEGIPVSTIKLKKDLIEFNEIPNFKTRTKEYKTGFVAKKICPLFKEIYDYVFERKQSQKEEDEKAINSGVPPKTIYLFEKDFPLESNEQFYWRVKKQLQRFLSKKGFTVHSLRVTRATKAGNDSGNVYYVQSITGHKNINMASEYVKKRNLLDNMKRYEGI